MLPLLPLVPPRPRAPPPPRSRTWSRAWNIVESGDGSLHKFGKRWYLYGTRYLPRPVSDHQCCYEWCGPVWLCGWRNMTMGVYSSPDLSNGSLMLETPSALPQALTHPTINTRVVAFFEPAVLFNPKTKKYVMWWVIQQHGGDGGMGVATADSPIGPFQYAWDSQPNVNRGRVPGWTGNADLYIWYSARLGKAYMKHNGQPSTAPLDPQANYVSELSDDFLSFTATSAPLDPGTYYEGGGIFERDGSWYVTFGQGCCFCNKGGSVMVHRSESPLGPYRFVNEINLAANASSLALDAVTAATADDICGGRGGRAMKQMSALVSPPVPSINLFGYYSGAHKDNAVMATNASEAWATANGYGRWGMFHGVAGAAASPAPTGGRWSELVSFYSAALEDWMLVSEDNANATAWISSKGYVRQREEGAYISAASSAGFEQPITQYWNAAINDTTLAGTTGVVKELEKQGYVKLCAHSISANASYNDSSCDANCPPVFVTPKQPYEIPAQQFGFARDPESHKLQRTHHRVHRPSLWTRADQEPRFPILGAASLRRCERRYPAAQMGR